MLWSLPDFINLTAWFRKRRYLMDTYAHTHTSTQTTLHIHAHVHIHTCSYLHPHNWWQSNELSKIFPWALKFSCDNALMFVCLLRALLSSFLMSKSHNKGSIAQVWGVGHKARQNANKNSSHSGTRCWYMKTNHLNNMAYYWVTGRGEGWSLVHGGRHHVDQRATQVGSELWTRYISSGATATGSGWDLAFKMILSYLIHHHFLFVSLSVCETFFLACLSEDQYTHM